MHATSETDTGHSDLRRRAVSYDLSGERLTERGLSGRPHPAPGPRTRRASAGQRYIRWFFRQYYRDPAKTAPVPQTWQRSPAASGVSNRSTGCVLRGSSACRMTLRRSALRRAFATHLVGVVLVVVAAQKLGQRGPATCTTTSRGDGGWMTTPLPARSAKTPDLHRFSPLENVRDTAYREDSGTGYRGSGPQVMATCRQHRDQPALPRWRHCYQPHSPGHRTRPDPHAQLPTAMRPDHKRRCRSRATRRVSRASHGDPGGGRRAPLPHRHRDRQRSGRDRPARRLGSSRAPIWTCQLASGRASRSATTSSMTCMRNAISASPRRCRFSAEHTNTVT